MGGFEDSDFVHEAANAAPARQKVPLHRSQYCLIPLMSGHDTLLSSVKTERWQQHVQCSLDTQVSRILGSRIVVLPGWPFLSTD